MELLNYIQTNKEKNLNKAFDLYAKGLYHNALAYYFRALNAAELVQDKDVEALIKHKITLCYFFELDYDQALDYCEDLLTNYTLESEQRELVLHVKASTLNRKGQFRLAEKLLKDLLFSDSLRIRFKAHTDLGLLYYFLHRFSEINTLELAVQNLNTAYEIIIEIGGEEHFNAASNKGLICIEKGEAKEALQYFEESLQLAGDDKLKTAQTQNELGRVYAMLGDMVKSEEYFEKAAKYALENSKFLTLTYNIYYRGLTQISLGKINSAYNYLHTALYSFLEHKHYPEVVAIYKILSELFEESHPQRAEYFLNEYHHYLNYIDPLGEE